MSDSQIRELVNGTVDGAGYLVCKRQGKLFLRGNFSRDKYQPVTGAARACKGAEDEQKKPLSKVVSFVYAGGKDTHGRYISPMN